MWEAIANFESGEHMILPLFLFSMCHILFKIHSFNTILFRKKGRCDTMVMSFQKIDVTVMLEILLDA